MIFFILLFKESKCIFFYHLKVLIIRALKVVFLYLKFTKIFKEEV